jgi:hypothetical protein
VVPETITLQRRREGPLAWSTNGRGQTVATRDGMVYVVAKVLRDEKDWLTFEGWPLTLRLPLSEERELKSQQVDSGKTVGATFLGLAGTALVFVGILAVVVSTGDWTTVERRRPNTASP